MNFDNRMHPIQGVVIGRVVDVSASGEVELLTEATQDVSQLARVTVPISPEDIGAEVVVMFENGDFTQPIILGKLLRPEAPTLPADAPVEVEVDGEPAQTLITGREKVVLRCGKASITLTAAGKVLIKGTYVSSRSSGMNRIKGGSVNLN